MPDRCYHRRLPCCGKKPRTSIIGNTVDCKCGFVYRAVQDGIWIKWERVTRAHTATLFDGGDAA